MSRNAYIFTITKSKFKETDVVEYDDLAFNLEYLYKKSDEAPDYLKRIGSITKIHFNLVDYDKACKDFFNCNYNSARYSEEGYTFFYENRELGFISNEKLKKYAYDKIEEYYIAKTNEICTIEGCYRLELDDGVYTFDRILDECIRIVANDEFETEQNLVYGLVKALNHIRNGEEIYIYVS